MMINANKNISRHLEEVLLELEELRRIIQKQNIRIEFLEKENKRLKALLETNSSNSSKPPSTDGFKKIFNSRVKTGKNRGGQPKHPGVFRKLYSEPTQIIEHKQKFCDCGHEILYDEKFSAKQHADIKISLDIIEHRAFTGVCPHCKRKHENKLPLELVNFVTYGNNLKTLTILLSAEGCISVNRINRLFREVSNGQLNLSDGTIINWLNEFAGKTKEELAKYKQELLESAVLHKDETSIDVGNNLWWLHVLSNLRTTLYSAHDKRGHEADDAMGVLPLYKKVLTHDHFAPLVKLQCEHRE